MNKYLKHSLIWLAVSFLVAVCGVCLAIELPAEGYFWTNPIVDEDGRVEICGEHPLNWVKVGEYNGKPIISVLINTNEDLAMAQRLTAHADFLGTPKQILQAAKAGNAQAKIVCKNCLYTLISDGEDGMRRVTMQQWIDLGRPEKYDKWRPYTRWFKYPEFEEDEEIL